MAETIDDYKKLLEAERRKVSVLDDRISQYEDNGPAKLYYSLNRKAAEMADLLNSIHLKDIAIEDPKDKTFERMRFIIKDSSEIATAVQLLGNAAGITGDEDADTKPRRRITTPESISDVLGNTAGQQD
jgi:hypothetical protein